MARREGIGVKGTIKEDKVNPNHNSNPNPNPKPSPNPNPNPYPNPNPNPNPHQDAHGDYTVQLPFDEDGEIAGRLSDV